MDADSGELYEMYKLITFRRIESEDLDYILEWITEPNKWSAGVSDMIRWLQKMPQREFSPLQDIVDVEALLEHVRR
jgi:hypothetical protein